MNLFRIDDDLYEEGGLTRQLRDMALEIKGDQI